MSDTPSNVSTFSRSKHDKQNPYVMISRELIHDRSISPGAKGVLAYLLSLPNDWKIIHAHLEYALNIGEHALNTIIIELLKAGYAKRTRQKVKGKYMPYHYEISENKIFFPDGFFQPGSSSPEKPGILSIESPSEILKETTTTEKQKAVAAVSSPKEKKEAEIAEIYDLFRAVDLDDASIQQLIKLKPDIHAVRASLELAKRSCYKNLGAWLHQCLKGKWWASNAKSKESEIEDEKAKIQAFIDARRQKASKLLKKYPNSFKIQDRYITVASKKGVENIAYSDEKIEAFFEYLVEMKGKIE